MTTTWIERTDDGVRIVHAAEGRLLVDYPALGRFRVLADVDTEPMTPVVAVPDNLPAAAGWYDGGIMLTHVPEAYFGEPMVMVSTDDRVVRAYPIGGDRFLTADGRDIQIATNSLVVDGRICRRSGRFAERQVQFQVGETVLAGTIITPTTPGPHPAAVLLHGAAGGQRDFCRFQAGPILAAGVAVLIYDKAGHGRSTGVEPSIFEQAAAAEGGIGLLGAQPDIDARRIGIAGFSNGMWAAPMAAARLHPAFLVGVGAPGVSMAESEVHRRTKVLRDAGVGPTTVAAVGEAWRAIFSIVAEGPQPDHVAELARVLPVVSAASDLSAYEMPEFVRQNPMLSPIPPLVPLAGLVAMLSDERDSQVAYDPAVDYAKLRCPVFLQYGAEDTSVPVPESVARIGAAATIRIYPNVEHMLNLLPDPDSGLSPEDAMYQFHDFTFAPGVWAELTDWLRMRIA
jgi:pimeloyl-ACP methyl ester carboxylesterase